MEVGGAVCGRPLAQRETIICHFFFPFFFSLLEKGIFVDQMKIVSTLHEYLFNNQCLTSEEKYWPVLSFKDKLNRIECISLVHASSISTLCRGDNFQKRNELVSSRFLRLGESNYRAGENSETRGRSFLQRGNSRKSQTSHNTRKSRVLRRRVYHEGEENSRWRKVERSRIYTRIPITYSNV